MSLTSFICQNSSTALRPKSHPAPLEFSCQFSISYQGSDHIRSHNGPEEGIYTFLYRVLIESIVVLLGESPPWTQNICPSTIAASGRQSKVSLKQYQTLWFPYFLAIQSQKPYTKVILRDQWFPLSSTTASGYLSLQRKRRRIVSTELYPRSTKSPINMYLSLGMGPLFCKSQSKSQNCPWTSPHMVTGACTG